MQARIVGAVARHESEQKRERLLSQREQAAALGARHGSPRPFGYESDGVTVRESEAVLIRVGTAAVLAGDSLRSIAADWNAAGATTSLRGRPWDRTAVRATLMRWRNGGLRQHGDDEPTPAVWPPVVSEGQLRAVRSLLSSPGRRTAGASNRAAWLLSGIARCPCGAVLRSASAQRPHRIYRCADGRGPGHVTIRLDDLNEYVETIVVARITRPDAVALLRPVGPAVDLDGLRAERDAATHRLDEIAEAFADGDMTRAQMRTATERATARRDRAQAALDTATRTTPLAGIVDAPDPVAAWRSAGLDRQRAVVAALMTITVLPRGPGRRAFDPERVRIGVPVIPA